MPRPPDRRCRMVLAVMSGGAGRRSIFRISSGPPDGLGFRGLHPAAQDLRDAPRLRDASSRRVWIDGVEDLADGTDARLVEVRDEAVEESASAGAVFRVHLEPGIDEGTDEPRPDGALMVRGVPCPEIAVIGRLEIGMVQRERAKPERRHELVPRDVDHRLPSRAVEHWVRQRNGEELVRATCGIVAPVEIGALDDIVEITALLVPEPFVERAPAKL